MQEELEPHQPATRTTCLIVRDQNSLESDVLITQRFCTNLYEQYASNTIKIVVDVARWRRCSPHAREVVVSILSELFSFHLHLFFFLINAYIYIQNNLPKGSDWLRLALRSISN